METYLHTPKEYPKDEQEADPDGDGLGDVDLLPVLVLELVEVLAARGADPGGGHASGGRAHLTIHIGGLNFTSGCMSKDSLNHPTRNIVLSSKLENSGHHNTSAAAWHKGRLHPHLGQVAAAGAGVLALERVHGEGEGLVALGALPGLPPEPVLLPVHLALLALVEVLRLLAPPRLLLFNLRPGPELLPPQPRPVRVAGVRVEVVVAGDGEADHVLGGEAAHAPRQPGRAAARAEVVAELERVSRPELGGGRGADTRPAAPPHLPRGRGH